MTAPTGSSGRWRVWAALGVAVVAVGVVIVLGQAAAERNQEPVTLVGLDQPGAASAGCLALMTELPDELGGLDRRETVGDATAAAAWGDPAAILRCGIPDPTTLDCSSALITVNGVSWLELAEPGLVSYIAVDRGVRVALTVDPVHGSAPLTALSDLVSAAMPSRPVCENGTLLPTDG